MPEDSRAASEPEAPDPGEAQASSPVTIPRPLRRRRPRSRQTQSVSLWLIFGAVMAVMVLYIAIRANVERVTQPVEGSSRSQQAIADSLLTALRRDSTDIRARVRLGDILYDTGNWSEAIVHYRAAVRLDSSLAAALVDLGVCYYNLGEADQAERHFRLALARDPHQPVALFNLGIVSERRDENRLAIEYFHRALQADPPEDVRQSIIQAMTRIQQKGGFKPQPLPGGS